MAKNAITKKINFDMALLPVIQNLATLGKSEADIGMIIGYAGRKPKKFIEQLKKQYPDVAIALEVGRRLADIELVTTAFEAAVGYDYVEETKDYKIVHIVNEETGEVTGEKRRLIKHKVSKKHQRPDSAILRMLLLSRLPDYFIDSKKVTLTQVMDSDPTEDEIRKFAGKLMQLVNPTKVIEARVIDSE
jgi:hypothetical protein